MSYESLTLVDKIIDLREKITRCTFIEDNEQFMKEMLDNIVEERKSLEVEAIKKNRHLKPRFAMKVDNNHTLCIEKLPAIRFSLNTAKCESTDHTATYLTFAREL
ncbi:hypothetical protein TNCV_1803021 [Trichonephila clavipes]|uniref:Uncharacterized protein n=1 Tax=Trichonephila clavipes TaxID=2585209 RepID=A0A8X6SS37_TRICX|nr:hypothetical protein TNCV_1803021 [Trichonephila clavipes]